MATRYFPAIIDKGAGGYGVTFPDLPGCTSGGHTIDDAARSAEEALALHIRGMIEDGEAIPEPTRIEDIAADPESAHVVPLLVRVEMPGKVVR
ncbi:MAG: type II toxin-antitoxin system HicB family antitoxin, partial [Alphaproteobacteria bacterium]|nr:type II toxin-antitoxin system HicB family antitoxin [Alphaproteobacteria bacterium]